MDRGRMLAAMDAELASELGAEPHTVPKMYYSTAGAGVVPTTMGTNVFWADAVFGVAKAVNECLERTTTVQVFAYQEAGEL
jgi:DNA-binding transcriptional regulator YhcF (GntR family)